MDNEWITKRDRWYQKDRHQDKHKEHHKNHTSKGNQKDKQKGNNWLSLGCR